MPPLDVECFLWTILTTVYIGAIVLLRLAISFALERKEKKTWMSLLVFASMWVLLSYDLRIYNGIGEIGNYFFHVTRLEYNRYVDWCIAGCIWVWIVCLLSVSAVPQKAGQYRDDPERTLWQYSLE